MQTFICYKSYIKSAQALDYRRLGKQRLECLQILQVLCGEKTGYKNHPATKMWKNHAGSLLNYGLIICNIWKHKGYKDTCQEKMFDLLKKYPKVFEYPSNLRPPWLNDKFCKSHQSNLIRKFPSHYQPIFGNETPDNLPYIWPI